MKKASIIIIIILVLSALAGTVIIMLDDYMLSRTHPLKYTDFVEKYSTEYAVPKEIVYAVIKTESAFQSDSVSHKGAIGLMQITPDTLNWLCSKTGEDVLTDQLYNPEINVKYGTYFLSMLNTEFGTWETAFAAYNAGRSRVSGWLSDSEISRNGRLVNIPYKETREYVQKVARAAEVYKRLYFTEKKANVFGRKEK